MTGATTPAGENNEEAQTAAAPSTSRRGSQAEGASADTPKQKSRMQLWNELKIICESELQFLKLYVGQFAYLDSLQH